MIRFVKISKKMVLVSDPIVEQWLLMDISPPYDLPEFSNYIDLPGKNFYFTSDHWMLFPLRIHAMLDYQKKNQTDQKAMLKFAFYLCW